MTTVVTSVKKEVVDTKVNLTDTAMTDLVKVKVNREKVLMVANMVIGVVIAVMIMMAANMVIEVVMVMAVVIMMAANMVMEVMMVMGAVAKMVVAVKPAKVN